MDDNKIQAIARTLIDHGQHLASREIIDFTAVTILDMEIQNFVEEIKNRNQTAAPPRTPPEIMLGTIGIDFPEFIVKVRYVGPDQGMLLQYLADADVSPEAQDDGFCWIVDKKPVRHRHFSLPRVPVSTPE